MRAQLEEAEAANRQLSEELQLACHELERTRHEIEREARERVQSLQDQLQSALAEVPGCIHRSYVELTGIGARSSASRGGGEACSLALAQREGEASGRDRHAAFHLCLRKFVHLSIYLG